MTTIPSALPDELRAVGRIHHVAIIVRDIEESLSVYRDLLGLELETVLPIESDRVIIAFLGVGESKIELVQPTDDTTGVARFLAAKGEGFHHLCLEVPDVAAMLIDLAARDRNVHNGVDLVLRVEHAAALEDVIVLLGREG